MNCETVPRDLNFGQMLFDLQLKSIDLKSSDHATFDENLF